MDGVIPVDKTRLANVYTCERYQVVEVQAGFPGWSAANVLGTVAHKAIELSVYLRGDPSPLELVDAAIDRLSPDAGEEHSGPGEFLRGASAVELAELRAEANERLVRFLESFPPLKMSWAPRLESRTRFDLCGQRIVLRSKPDLVLGRARGCEARVLLVDFKTGAPYRRHVEDLRFYALLETLRSRLPPFRVATYYLDAGTFHSEDVSVELLDAAIRRTVDGVLRIVELAQGDREPELSPGPACRWCRVRTDCEGARRWRDAHDEAGG